MCIRDSLQPNQGTNSAMIDTHVNLHHHLYENDLEEVLNRAKDGEIHGMPVSYTHLDVYKRQV